MTVRHVVGTSWIKTLLVSAPRFEQSLRASGPQTFSAIKGGAQEPIAMYLDLNRAKFIPIIDKTFVVGATGSVDGYNAKTFDHTVNLRDKRSGLSRVVLVQLTKTNSFMLGLGVLRLTRISG